MADTDIYDKEKKSHTPGEHDDLGVHPERREAEVSDLEDAYNAPSAPEEDDKAASPEELDEAEKSGAEGAQNGSRPYYPPEESFLDLAGGMERFYTGDDKPKRFSIRTPVGKFNRRGRVAIGAGAGLIGLIIFGASLFSFLNVFRLDHMLQNIDSKTFSRYNAQFSNRSNTYLKAYIRIRMMQFGDKSTPDANGNMFFRANHVNTGNPVADWYATIKTSKFEQDLLEQDGIAFTSVLRDDGTLRPGKITLKDESIGFDPQKELSPDLYSKLTSGHPAELASAINSTELSDSIDKFVDKQIFNSDKAARQEIKTVVNDHTKFFQVLKRRRLRKNIQNMIGVRDWTFFETTVAKYQEKKFTIQQKILGKLFPDNNALANLMECVFVGTNCKVNTDAEAKVASGENLPSEVNSATNGTDANGKPTTTDLGGDQQAPIAAQAIEDTATDPTLSKDAEVIAGKAAKTEDTSISQRFLKVLIEKWVGPEAANDATAEVNPGAWWRWAKRLASIRDMVKNHVLSKAVKNARLAQDIALFTMYSTARDQIKTGQVTAQGVKDLMGTTDGFDNSEGWQQVTSGDNASAVSAASVVPQPAKTKQEYCNGTHIKLKTEFAWNCDDQKPNGGSTAATLESSFNSTVGPVINPIADVVDGVKHIPIIGGLVDTFSGFVNNIIGKVADWTLIPAMNALGIPGHFVKLMTFVMGKALDFLGAAPKFTGGQPGVANYLITGSAGAAESSTRAAGGVASTPTTLAYDNNVTTAYLNNQHSQQSMFERYASVNNPDSLASKSLFSVANLNMSSFVSSITNIFSNTSSVFANILSGRIFAANTPKTPSSIAQWAGVDTYDIPQQCQKLDPLDPNYTHDAVGVQGDSPWASQAQSVLNGISGSITPATVRDEAGFWKLVYDKIGSGNDNAGDIASAIYNCALFDQQVEGGIGYLYGYTDDGGLSSGTQAAASTPASSSGYSNPFRDVPNLSTSRIDQGVDYNGTGPVYAIGNGTVVDANPDSGWPGNGQNSGGTFIAYQLSDGPAAGKYVFMAEDCNVAVTKGQLVTANTVLCNMYNGNTAIETGWAEPGTSERALAHDEYTCDDSRGSISTSLGLNFSDLLVSLGAKPGRVQTTGQNTQCPGSPSTKPLPAGWPTWK